MVDHYLSCVVLLSSVSELTEIIHQWPHTGRELQHSIHQLTQWDFTCRRRRKDSSPVCQAMIVVMARVRVI